MRTFKIVITGHGPFPDALMRTAEMICGHVDNVSAISIGANDSPDTYAAALAVVVDQGRTTGETLVLCDIHGGTPSNTSAVLARRYGHIITISGINLAMVVEAIMTEGDLSDAVVKHLVEVGRSSISATLHKRA